MGDRGEGPRLSQKDLGVKAPENKNSALMDLLQKKGVRRAAAAIVVGGGLLLAGCSPQEGNNPLSVDVPEKARSAENNPSSESSLPGYFHGRIEGSAEEAVIQAFKTSLEASGMSADEAEQKGSLWGTLNPNMQVVIESEEGIQVFDGARVFWEEMAQDSDGYPSGGDVFISSKADKGPQGSRLSDLVKEKHDGGYTTTFYWWGNKPDGSGFGTVNSTIAEPPQGLLFKYGIAP